MKITFFESTSGRLPVLSYIKKLPKKERASILQALDEVEKYGFDATKVRFRQIEGKLWELKISAHRVFYVILSVEEMVLLHAYKKQGQKLPLKERKIAIKRMKETLQ